MESIVACGIDIIEISRVRRVYERYGERFLRKVFSAGEQKQARARRDPVTFLAGRFAAKEAVLKVLGVGIFEGVPLPAIEIAALPSGEPICVLREKAAARAGQRGIKRVLVSISHAENYAVAQALGLGGQEGKKA